ncbi:type III secretion system cytoplasmic ring protein SctQ [Chromobacterium violaceum]|uniref:type III secretion system cytoplasmic ring protein SctQ n=1 Tax=Chromobacterium violaceum TaxID=536 RepID=UPI0009B5AAEB|nr:type III secretion system cytoplasmic ring protein SctQ [Chromobacterium violaceum]
MPIPRLSKETGLLLSKVGHGRRLDSADGSLILSFNHREAGPGLSLIAQLDDQPVRLWMAEAQWLQWVEPMLSLPSWDMAPPDLRELLAVWTLADAGSGLDDLGLPWPQATRLEPEPIDAGMGWRLRILRDERQLDLLVRDAPQSWLDAVAEQAYPIEMDETETAITAGVSLIAGWSMVEMASVRKLVVGDALLLRYSFDVAAGKFGLFNRQPIASLMQDGETGIFTVETLMSDFEDWMDITPTLSPAEEQALGDAMITVTVEVAKMELPLHQLGNLQPGTLLSSAVSSDGLVTLKAGSRPIARGTLLDIDSRLAVRIEHLC